MALLWHYYKIGFSVESSDLGSMDYCQAMILSHNALSQTELGSIQLTLLSCFLFPINILLVAMMRKWPELQGQGGSENGKVMENQKAILKLCVYIYIEYVVDSYGIQKFLLPPSCAALPLVCSPKPRDHGRRKWCTSHQPSWNSLSQKKSFLELGYPNSWMVDSGKSF